MTYDAQLENDDIDLEACLWVTKIDGGNMTDEDYSELRSWIRADAKHKAAFETYATDFLVVDDILSTVSEAISEIEKQGGASRSVLASSNPTKSPRLRNPWSGFAAGLAAACIALVAVMAMGLPSGGAPQPTTGSHFAAHSGDQKTVELPDGSSVMMNTQSEIRVAYTQTERLIYLDKGEAVFDVEKDASRPFTVSSGDTVVRAIGTIFSVRTFSDSVEVLVEEGVVELMPPADIKSKAGSPVSTNGAIRLEQGGYTRVSLSDGISQRAADLEYVERRLAWREGVLSFDQDLLADVVREFNRYSEKEIVIVDDDLAELKIGGVFPIERTDAFLDALEAGFDVEIEYANAERIEISKEK